ncbi:MAG: DivIVA domain-containing protein [Desulfobulbaceae bacterium]|nr:DivIVA domain-containing protein [Desulfobulbaceae bacterium]HIJ90833.1 DivIVA domain-containing protein [Deltaproteobacteria bacterium]
MILTAQDIQSQQFHVRFRGFDVEEVDDFLEKISAAYQAISDENQKLKGRLETLEKDLATYQNQQKSFQSAIIAAQNVADGMKEKSREEAEAIVAEAKEEARLRRDDANYEIAELKRKIEDLKSLREQARDELRQQLKSYLHMLETEPADHARAVEHFSSSPRQPEPMRTNSYAARSTTVETEPSRPRRENAPASSDEADLADLYVKIDIPESDMGSMVAEKENDYSPQDIDLGSSISARKDMLVMDEDEDTDTILPDLDGDMAFSLEDPLESHEPAVSFAGSLEDATKKKRNRFNPDESPL